jgi:hypothetical protein
MGRWGHIFRLQYFEVFPDKEEEGLSAAGRNLLAARYPLLAIRCSLFAARQIIHTIEEG